MTMLARKTSAITICCTCGGSVPSPTTPRHSSSVYSRQHTPPRHPLVLLQPSARTYATPSSKDALPAWPKKPHPTPYEIFDISKNSPYTKRRFYQLVKLYHPDTHGPSTLEHAVLLERYRLVVAANNLLSDPAKRRLYDNHGIGWSDRGPGAAPTARERENAWRHQPGNAARNATWEDWQRWYEAQDPNRPKAEPVYASNGTFAFIVVAACFIGALAHINRAETIGAEYVEYSAQRNADIGNQVRRTTLASSGRSRDERVNAFMRDRENTTYQFVPAKYDAPEKHS